MKKIFYSILITISLLLIATPVFAVNPNGAQFINWKLSEDVMPTAPCGPYGTRDIPGSDIASKLIVNQPNGNTKVTITAPMKGLNPNTIYTVYLSKSYEPYQFTGWSVVGAWEFRLFYGSSTYDHDIVITSQSGGSLSGTGGYPAIDEPPYDYPYNETLSGTIDPVAGTFTLHSDYENTYYYDLLGTVAGDETVSGTWQGKNQPQYSWESISGQATCLHTGNSGWPGLFTSTVQPFTFATDEYGEGSWHINLREENFSEPGDYNLSVWINEAGRTILISDVFSVTVD